MELTIAAGQPSNYASNNPHMHRLLYAISALLLVTGMLPSQSAAQPLGRVYDGIPMDSAVISFSDTAAAIMPTTFSVTLDTSHTTLWRMGTTSKSFFNQGISGRPGIMTDTMAPYPLNANEWFSLKLTIPQGYLNNPIIGFTHKYQTAARQDGGVVEYSFDSLNWNNVVGGCYVNTVTDSFYKDADTLRNGSAAFSGTGGWKTSRFQFFQGIPIKTTARCSIQFPVWVRFRFVSDTTTDSLAGWIIRSIKIERDHYSGDVADARRLPHLNVYPNPSANGIFNWPALEGAEDYTLRLTNALGQLSYQSPYMRKTDLSMLPAGLYYYRVDDGVQTFAGTLRKE